MFLNSNISPHLKGILITTLGVIILSPDALLVRLVDANTWTLLFWRGLLFSLGISLLIYFSYGRKFFSQFKKIGRLGLLLGLFFGFSTIFFIAAIQFTSIANALVIISTSPVFSALLSWAFLKEKTKIRTWITMIVIIIAMVVIMFDSYQSGGFFGDLCALVTSILLAIIFTITRLAKHINMVPAMALGGLVTAFISALVIGFTASLSFSLDASAIPYLLVMGVVITLSFSLIILGPRYMPAAEVSMIMPLETVFGSYLGWLFINEVPSNYVLIGGAVILVTLMIHSWLSVKGGANS